MTDDRDNLVPPHAAAPENEAAPRTQVEEALAILAEDGPAEPGEGPHAPQHAAAGRAGVEPRHSAVDPDPFTTVAIDTLVDLSGDPIQDGAHGGGPDPAAGTAPDEPEADRRGAPKGAGAPSDPEGPSGTSPEDTAEIDADAVEAKLQDPGTTQSFEPIKEERIDADSTFDAGTTTSLMWGARSDVGCVRSHNEDSYLVQSPLFCVCDGMGGHAAGEVASSIAVETIAKTAPKAADPALLAASVEAANAAIIEAAVNGMGKPGMGCTATAAYIDGATLAIAHVGDSRAYILHEGTLIRVTRDHSYVEELVEAGEITADEARVHPNRSVITRALGSDPLMYADHFQLSIEEGDRLILCSDGLSSMVSDGDIERIAAQSGTAQVCTDNLVDAALAAGGSDNVTVIVVDVVNDGRLKELSRKHRRNALIVMASILAALAVGALVTFFSISHSVYLGVKDGSVAIYSGVAHAPFGLTLHWLQDETSVKLSDLPEDTRNRLYGGIPQEDMEDAQQTVESYRKQIDDQKAKQAEDAAAIANDSADAGSADPDAPADSVAGTGSTAPADSVAPSNGEGGDK